MNGSSPIQQPQQNTNIPISSGAGAPSGMGPGKQDGVPEGKKEQERGGLSRLRTFRADTERFVKEKGVTLTSLVANKKERVIEAPRLHSGHRTLIIICVLLLVLGGAAAAFFFLGDTGMMPDINSPEKPKSVYPLFDDRTITVRNSPSEFIPEWQNLLLRSIPQDQMLGVFVFNEVRNRYLSPGEWFDFLGIQVPPSLRASMRAPWTLGVFGLSSGAEPVFIIPVTSFEQALSGMLAWEQDQPLVLRNLLPQGYPERKFEKFQDAIIQNQDVRFLKNEQGQMILVYGFFDRNILIITTSFETMEKVIERFFVAPPSI